MKNHNLGVAAAATAAPAVVVRANNKVYVSALIDRNREDDRPNTATAQHQQKHQAPAVAEEEEAFLSFLIFFFLFSCFLFFLFFILCTYQEAATCVISGLSMG